MRTAAGRFIWMLSVGGLAIFWQPAVRCTGVVGGVVVGAVVAGLLHRPGARTGDALRRRLGQEAGYIVVVLCSLVSVLVVAPWLARNVPLSDWVLRLSDEFTSFATTGPLAFAASSFAIAMNRQAG